MKLLWETGIALFDSENRAIVLYVCFSMALLALAIACLAGYLYSRGLKRRYLILLLPDVVYKGPVFAYFEVEEPDIIESLSTPT